MPKRVNKFTSEEIERHIEYFLENNGPSYFGEIQNHLEKKLKIKFKNSDKDRSGLAHTLKRMQKIRKLPKNKDHKYPRYVSLKQSTFDVSLDGYLFRTETCSILQSAHNEIFNEMLKVGEMKNLSRDQEFILKNIFRFGILFLYLLLSSYTRPIDKKESLGKNNEMRQAWLNNALDFNNRRQSEAGLFNIRLKQFFNYDGTNLDESIFKKEFFSDSDMEEKISHMYKTTKNLFPETFEIMEMTEKVIDNIKNNIKQSWLTEPQEKLPMVGL